MLNENKDIEKDLREAAEKIKPLNNQIADVMTEAANEIEALKEDVRLYKGINEALSWTIFQYQSSCRRLETENIHMRRHMCSLCKDLYKDKDIAPSCEGCHFGNKGGEK